jgi:hypothetical protein
MARFVMKSDSGNWRIWDNKIKRLWGPIFSIAPYEIISELNNKKRPEKISALLKRFEKAKSEGRR